MPETKYQIFLSSTYQDLVDERNLILQAILNLNHIPVGMELFPASIDDTWNIIKKIIDECDYYILITNSRYGTIVPNEDISFTEKEYSYAQSINKPILSFVNDNFNKEESDNHLKLEEFIEKIKNNGKNIRFWSKTKNDLLLHVLPSINHAFENSPQTGWIQANKLPEENIYKDINNLRAENNSLKQELEKYKCKFFTPPENLQQGSDIYNLQVTWSEYTSIYEKYEYFQKAQTYTWNQIFFLIAPETQTGLAETIVKSNLTSKAKGYMFRKEEAMSKKGFEITDISFNQIKIQLQALRLINVELRNTTSGSCIPFWELTSLGKQKMFDDLALKKIAIPGEILSSSEFNLLGNN